MAIDHDGARHRHAAPRRVSRRQLLGLLGAAGVGAGVAGAVRLPAHAEDTRTEPPRAAPPGDVVPFFGAHQAGIATPQPAHVTFAAIDVGGASGADLRDLLRTWTGAAARMTRGLSAEEDGADRERPPADTGEAAGLPASNLTITFGAGPSLFEGRLAGARPRRLVHLPPFPGDRLDPARSGGDLCIQACADDGQVAFHAVRELLRLGHGVATARWSQAGFMPGRVEGQSPRNLLGFRDGTNNLSGGDAAALDRFVWVGAEGPRWLRGGSYLVARRIRVHVEPWDRTDLGEQEEVFGRRKTSGAPFGGHAEHDRVRLDATRPDGKPLIPIHAHIRQAGPATNHGQRILRRGYSFADGVDASGHLDAGLFFLAYQRDPLRQFVQIQQRLATMDALNEYTEHTGSAVFAVFPGVQPGDFIGRGLF